MIETASIGKLNPDEKAFLALSTIYGLRREEMCNIRHEDLDFKKGTIYIRTIKKGRERYHLIPSEIKAVLQEHDFARCYSIFQLSRMFWSIVNKSGMSRLQSQELGWHTIRRGLKTLLDRSGLDPFTIHQFMRWQGGERGFAMDARYHATHFVTLDGEESISDEAEADKEVFKKHPFIKLWR